jgi:16S rRNA (cytosine1402-N4)-methyltransferase
MNETPDPSPHRRRPRYSGKHPRRFEDKYKEHAPERYPELIAHVRQRGMTPAGQHVPIMVEEVLATLAPRAGDRGVDATLGYGGHARRFLDRIRPGGQLLGLDADPIELPKTVERLRGLDHDEQALLARRTNFASLGATLCEVGWNDGVDFLFADLGVSSMQIDDPTRGFAFKHDGPLDMRMNPSRGVSAAQWLERATFEQIKTALRENADEAYADPLALALAGRRAALRTTRELAELIHSALPRLDDDGTDLVVRRVFQALRIQVNDEFGVLEALLRQIPDALRSGGRAAVLTFHSGEDRRVKKAFERACAAGQFAEVSDGVVRASFDERRANPRSGPAKLRWARKA